MIYRVTAQFMKAFDALSPAVQAQALVAMRGFKVTPRQPSPYSHIVSNLKEGDDVWNLPFGDGWHITYAVHAGDHPEHFVCVLRHVGKGVAYTSPTPV
jgi:hypothetical protein